MAYSDFIPKKHAEDSPPKDLLLADVIDIDQWQLIQDHFAEVLGVSLRTVDVDGKPITSPSLLPRLCSDVVSCSLLGLQKCADGLTPFLAGAPQPKCLPSIIVTGDRIRDVESFGCHIGLTNFIVPITVAKSLQVGHMIAGPVMLGVREDESKYIGMAVELGISVDELMDALREIKLFSYSGIESVVQLIKDVSHYITQLGYQKIKLKTILPTTPKVEAAVTSFYHDKLFGTLLEAASIAMDAEVGSVMLINPDTGELYIKLAKGLKQDIIEKAKMKLGEGLSGLAAKEKRSLFISDETKDEKVRQRLNRPELKSAMIVPITPEGSQDVYGVINIGTCRTESTLTKEKVTLMEQLVNLAGIALGRLGPSKHS